VSLPPLTPDQRAAAAPRGGASRQVRAEVRRSLGSGALDVADVLADGQRDDDRGRILARMKVVDLISSFRGIGPVRAEALMRRIGIAANRRLGGLGVHQIEALTGALGRDRATGRNAGP
jgi:hypothetical protein